MRFPLAKCLMLAVTVVLTAVTMSASTAASEPEAALFDHVGSNYSDVGDSEQGEWVIPDHYDAQAAVWPGRNCKFQARAHWPHHSGTDVSGHGNWANTSNPSSRCPDLAYVTVHLQSWGCLQVFPYTCHWRTQATKSQYMRSGDQVPVHVPCELREPGSWRTYTVVKVPISGWLDKWDTDTSPSTRLNCRPRNLR